LIKKTKKKKIFPLMIQGPNSCIGLLEVIQKKKLRISRAVVITDKVVALRIEKNVNKKKKN
jgi:hypothetical protein